MARQATAPVQFNRSVRTDEGVLMSSGRAGVVLPIGYIPLLRGDSAAGRVSVDINLAEMPRPLLNAVFANVQAWFVPKSIHPQFSGSDEFLASYAKQPIKQIGQADRTAPSFYLSTVAPSALASTLFAKTIGLHPVAGRNHNTDVIDAFNIIYNFRLAAHSTKLTRKKYYLEDPTEAVAFPRAFWPSGRFAAMVPDYESEIVVGSMDLDITAGQLPVRGLYRVDEQTPLSMTPANVGNVLDANTDAGYAATTAMHNVFINSALAQGQRVWAEFGAGTTITSSLADISTAKLTQSFAKVRSSMAGNNTTGFVNDDTILAHLMQGLSVPEDQFKRPWLLDSKRVPFGFAERHATDAANLDQSVVTGRTGVALNLNIPSQDIGGMIIFTLEVLPERLDERQADDFWTMSDPNELPNALRDIQNPEPVDLVKKSRIDAAHTDPDGLYGYEPLNNKWNRTFTRLGGVFYQPTPGAPVTDQRMGIWQANVIDPEFTSDHWLAPDNFPHYVFADTQADAFEFVVRHSLKIVGLTQIGDMLVEDNSEWADTDAVADQSGADT